MSPPTALAIALAAAAAPPAVHEAPPPATVRGWLGVGGRNAFGLPPPIDADFGAEAMGGVWLLREYLQPIARVGWSRGGGGGSGLTIDALRVGAGLAAGAPLAQGLVWLGLEGEVDGVAAFARSPTTAPETRGGATLGLAVVFQARLAGRFLVGVDAGPQVGAPALEFAGPTGTAHWGPLRINAGLRLGVILGPPVAPRPPTRSAR